MCRTITICAKIILLTAMLYPAFDLKVCAAPKPSSSPDVSTSFAKRVVKTFDFNEKQLGNLEDIPMDWEKVTLSGFPHYVNGQFDDLVGNPKPSFKLPLNGGNIGYVFSERVIPAFPGSDHKIFAYVKTQNLRYARGYMQAFYMDRFGKLLPDTITYSPLIGPPNPGDPEWRSICVELPYTNNEGRFIGIGIFLVQQDHMPPVFASPFNSFRKDINATLWLDEVTILRLPKTRLNLINPTALYNTNQPVVIGATVADAKTNDLSAKIVIKDLADGTTRTVSHPVAILPPLEAILRGQATAPGLVRHNLGKLLPGLYKISLQVLTHSDIVIDKAVNIAVLNHQRPAESTMNFGLDLSSADINNPLLTADFAGTLKPAWAVLPIWRQDIPICRNNADESPSDKMIIQFNHKGIAVLGNFLNIPNEMSTRANIMNPTLWDFLAGKTEWWRSELSIILSRHADRIDHWVFGKDQNCWQNPDPRIQPVLQSMRKEFSQFQGQFSLLPSWPGMVSLPADQHLDGCFVTVPPELLPGSFGEYFKAWENPKQNLWFVLPGQELNEFQLEPAMVDFVNRFIEAKRQGIPNLAACNLWTTRSPNAPGGIEPNAYYVAFANLIDRLSGLDYLGSIEIDHGRFGLLFTSQERTVLVLANSTPKPYQVIFSLGDQLQAYDLWGRPLPIKITDENWFLPYRPIIFIDNVDTDLARFIASVKFLPDSVPSKFGAHQIHLTFRNTFPQGINGLVRLQGPFNWQFDPSGSRFAIPMGKDFSLPIKLRFPSNEPIGRKSIDVRFDLEARRLVHLNICIPLHIGLSDLEMRVIWFLRDQEMIVSQEIQNKSEKWTDLIAFTIAPNRPRMERQVRHLGPGQTAIKEYSLGSWKEMLGKTIRVGFQEVRGTRLVNEVITLE